MKYFKTLALLFFVVMIVISSGLFAYQEMIIRNVKVDGVAGSKPVRVIKVVLDGQDFIVNSLATTGGDTLKNLMDKVGGHTAMNGIFFCPASYSYCNGKTFSNFERVFNGKIDEQSKRRPDTGIRGIFGFEKSGSPLLVQNNLSEMPGYWSDINKEKIEDIHFGMSNFPILINHGENVVQYSSEYLDEKLSGRQNRHFICSTEDRKTIYMGVIGLSNLYETADIMIQYFNCWNGINLDAGGSANMIYKDTTLQKNSRKIMDARVVVNREQYKKITHLDNEKIKKLDPYLPERSYLLNKKEKKQLTNIKKIFPIIIKKKGDKSKGFKRKLIKEIRKLASTPNIEKNIKTKKILNEILIILFGIEV